MNILSEKYIKQHCPHCDPTSYVFIDLLEETDNFRIICDRHPLIEGHVVIIPKQHISCVGEYSNNLFNNFIKLYNKVFNFIQQNYGTVSTFEHGKIGQTVFHSHVHLLPFNGRPTKIITEGMDRLKTIKNLKELKNIFQKENQYLFFSIGSNMWVVDNSLGKPRFFRDRFAIALNKPKYGNWKEMHKNKKIMKEVSKENDHCKKFWQK